MIYGIEKRSFQTCRLFTTRIIQASKQSFFVLAIQSFFRKEKKNFQDQDVRVSCLSLLKILKNKPAVSYFCRYTKILYLKMFCKAVYNAYILCVVSKHITHKLLSTVTEFCTIF